MPLSSIVYVVSAYGAVDSIYTTETAAAARVAALGLSANASYNGFSLDTP